MSDKIVTHEDLGAISVIETGCALLSASGEAADLLRRIRAAAEADAPPLPEGWTVRTYGGGHQRVFWCDLVGNMRNDSAPDSDIYYTPADVAKRPGGFTPLRPTISAGEFEGAVEVLRRRGLDFHAEHVAAQMFGAAGIEVQP